MDSTIFVQYGHVTKASGLTVHCSGLTLAIGDICEIVTSESRTFSEVIAVTEESSVLMVFDKTHSVSVDSIVYKVDKYDKFRYSDSMLGCVVDAFGKVEFGSADLTNSIVLEHTPLEFNQRRSVNEAIDVGVSSINSLLTLGKGQRVGVMAGSGVGKSVLLSMMAKHTDADVCVCALIGERSREVVDFVEKTLNSESRQKTVIVSSPADSSPLTKIRATEYAMRIAEHYSSTGKSVVLLFDSLTRYAHALRTVGLESGEPPTMKGYPPSVFTKIPQLVERSGNAQMGSITSIFTVLMDGDDENDPVVDSARSILDGHIVLTRRLASRGHYPAIDVTKSVSRCMSDIVDSGSYDKATQLKQMVSIYNDNEELMAMGAYVQGGNPDLDISIQKMPAINNLLRQKPSDTRNLALSAQYLFSV